MSPEQVKGARAVDHRADLWAVGVMFYEMVAGASPFPSDGDDPNNIWGLISAVLTKDPVSLARIDPSLAQYDAFIARALCKNVDQRYATAREMCEDLLRIARGERPMASVPPPASAMVDPARMPVNSRGDLPHIPPVMGQAAPRSVQITPVSGSAGDINSTMPTGGPNAASAQLAATMPVDSVMAQQQMQQIQQARMQVAAYQGPGVAPAYGAPPMTPQSGMAATAFAPQNPAVFPTQGPGMSPAPMGGYGASPIPPSPVSPMPMMQGAPPGATPLPPTPRFGTAPTGYQPPPQPAQGGGMGVLPWILLGAFLLGALVFAVIWLLS
jgi:serine/threonine-protein kinase